MVELALYSVQVPCAVKLFHSIRFADAVGGNVAIQSKKLGGVLNVLVDGPAGASLPCFNGEIKGNSLL